MSDSDRFLRRVLVADAAVSGAAGVLMALGAGALEPILELPAALLRPVGLSLVPFAAVLVSLARRSRISRSHVGAVIAINAVWVAASVLLLLSGLVEPNALGAAFVVAQAVAVAALAEMQYVGLRKAAAAA